MYQQTNSASFRGAVVIRTCIECFRDVKFIASTGQKYDGFFEVADFADVFQYFKPRHAWDTPIENK